MFKNVKLNELWYDSEETKKYECGPLDDEMIKKTEEQLGFKLPQSYIYLMKKHNGGKLQKNYLAFKNTDGYNDLSEIYGIGDNYNSINYQNKDKTYYEANLISIASSNSGHAKTYLDYNECGPQGEPRVIAIDEELNINGIDVEPRILADNFEDFISRLCFEEDEKEIEKHDTIKYFKADEKTHKAVKKYVLFYGQIGFFITTLIITLLIIIGIYKKIYILLFLAPIDLFLIIGYIVLQNDILKRKYKCWYDTIKNITTEKGKKKYELKETNGKIEFIIRKNEKLEIGDKVLCISGGYAFKWM